MYGKTVWALPCKAVFAAFSGRAHRAKEKADNPRANDEVISTMRYDDMPPNKVRGRYIL